MTADVWCIRMLWQLYCSWKRKPCGRFLSLERQISRTSTSAGISTRSVCAHYDHSRNGNHMVTTWCGNHMGGGLRVTYTRQEWKYRWRVFREAVAMRTFAVKHAHMYVQVNTANRLSGYGRTTVIREICREHLVFITSFLLSEEKINTANELWKQRHLTEYVRTLTSF